MWSFHCHRRITTALAPITATVVTATTLVTMATFIHPSNVVSVAPSTTILEAFHHNSHFEQGHYYHRNAFMNQHILPAVLCDWMCYPF